MLSYLVSIFLQAFTFPPFFEFQQRKVSFSLSIPLTQKVRTAIFYHVLVPHIFSELPQTKHKCFEMVKAISPPHSVTMDLFFLVLAVLPLFTLFSHV